MCVTMCASQVKTDASSISRWWRKHSDTRRNRFSGGVKRIILHLQGRTQSMQHFLQKFASTFSVLPSPFPASTFIPVWTQWHLLMKMECYLLCLGCHQGRSSVSRHTSTLLPHRDIWSATGRSKNKCFGVRLCLYDNSHQLGSLWAWSPRELSGCWVLSCHPPPGPGKSNLATTPRGCSGSFKNTLFHHYAWIYLFMYSQQKHQQP